MQPLAKKFYQDQIHKAYRLVIVLFCALMLSLAVNLSQLGLYADRVSDSKLIPQTCTSLALSGVPYSTVLSEWTNNPRLDSDGENGPCSAQYGKHPGAIKPAKQPSFMQVLIAKLHTL